MPDSIDRDQKSIDFERLLDAAPHEVFDAWTRPEEVTRWWDPTGAPLSACTIDLRVDGAFRFVTAGHAPPFEGTYEVIDRPRRLEFRAMGAHGIVELETHGAGTRMTVSIRCASAEQFEMFVELGVATGTSATLDNLARQLSQRRPASPR